MTLPVTPNDQVASGPVPVSNADLLALIRRLSDRLTEEQRRTLYSVSISDGELLVQGNGSIRVVDAEGNNNLFVGGLTGSQARPDGTPQRAVVFRDDNGQARWAIWDPDPSDGYQQAIYEWDHLGNIVKTTDRNGGWAEPWLPVTMYPKFTPSASTWSYMTIDNGLIHTERQVWEGRIVYVSHPRLQLDGVWGIGSGTSSTPVYNLKLNGTTVDTWSQAALTVGQRDPINIEAYRGQRFVGIELTVQASTGTGAAIAAQILGCAQRQT